MRTWRALGCSNSVRYEVSKTSESRVANDTLELRGAGGALKVRETRGARLGREPCVIRPLTRLRSIRNQHRFTGSG